MKPPITRHTVMPMSCRKPYSVNSSTPSRAMVMGLARKVGETKPPSVTAAQTRKNSTKKATPSTHLAVGLTGSSGAMRRRRTGAGAAAGAGACGVAWVMGLLAGWTAEVDAACMVIPWRAYWMKLASYITP